LDLKNYFVLLRVLYKFAFEVSEPIRNGSWAHDLWIFCLGLAAIVVVPQCQPA
jgi:hypothetical protein